MRVHLVVLLAIIATGCSSMRSTMLHRGECDMEWETERFLNGVPITVEVPTHIKVDVVEHHYLGYAPKLDADGSFVRDENNEVEKEVVWLSKDDIGVPARTVNTSLIKTAQIFTVDPKRPAAGTLNQTIDFAGKNGQYIDKIQYKVDDQTIEAITGLVNKIAKKGLVGTPTSDESATSANVDKNLYQVQGIVASGVFSLDAPDVEIQVSNFLDVHLNNCHNCNVVLDDVIPPTQGAPIVGDSCTHGSDVSTCPKCNQY